MGGCPSCPLVVSLLSSCRVFVVSMIIIFYDNHILHDIIILCLRCFDNPHSSCKNFVYRDMADVPRSLYRRYLEVSEATFQAQPKNHIAGDVRHFKPIINFSSPYKGVEKCLPCHPLQYSDVLTASLSARHLAKVALTESR
jgi:hypothetical protein